MVKIVSDTATHWHVQWSQPEGNPAVTRIDKRKKILSAEELQLMLEWEKECTTGIDLTSSPE